MRRELISACGARGTADAALESFRAASINLASNVFCVENLPDPNFKKSGLDPQTYMQVVAVPEKHTCWDQVVLDTPGLTLQQFLDKFAEVHHGCVIDTLIPIGGSTHAQGKLKCWTAIRKLLAG